MSVKMTSLVWGLDLRGNQLVIMLAVADEADSDGVCFTGQKKLAVKARVSERTLRSTLAAMKDRGLLHTERRPAEWCRGRKTDAIILDPRALAQAGVVVAEDPEETRQRRENRKHYEVDPRADDGLSEAEEPVENSDGVQPATFAGRYISPSQPEPANFAGRSDQPAKSDVQPATFDVQPAKSDTSEAGALIGTRARLTRQSRQSPSFIPEDAPAVDGRTDGPTGQATSQAHEPAPATPAKIVAGVSLRHLRAKVGQALPPGVSDEVLERVVLIVLGRASRTPSSPLAFVARAVSTEPAELVSQAEALLAGPVQVPAAAVDEQAWSEFVAEAHAQADELPVRTCPIHGVDYTHQCPGCRSDRLAGIVPGEEPAQAPEEDAARFRARLRAQRAEREQMRGQRGERRHG